jgi:trans-aconitate 2-methyltransferase
MPWNPEQYHRFQRERFAPFADLLQLVDARPGLRAIDLGCGTGELTRRLADALPGSDVLGIDSSPEMLARAEGQARPGLRFELANLRDLAGGWDLIFSHAVLQWVEDHAALIPMLLGRLNPGGQLVVQMPSNHTHPTHRLIIEVASEEPFRTALSGWRRAVPVLGVEQYADLLFASGAEDLTVFEKVYPHVLPDSDALAEWTRGTALIPYLERMQDDLHEPFLERYRALLRQQFPQQPVFYGFRRILLAARAPQPSAAG